MSSKVRRYTNYDNDPNSIFGASKRVIQEYRKKLDMGEKSTAPIQAPTKQGITTKEGESVVKYLNEYSGMIRKITGDLNQVEVYITTEFKAPEDEEITGSGRRKYKYRGGAPPTFSNANDARNYIIQKYKNSSENISKEDREVVKRWNLVSGMELGNTQRGKLIVDKIEAKPVKPPKQPTIKEAFKVESALDDDLDEEELEQEFRQKTGQADLEAKAEAEPRFTDSVKPIDIQGGEPDEDEEQAEDQDEYWLNQPLPDDEEWMNEEEEEEGGEPEEGEEGSMFDWNAGEDEEEQPKDEEEEEGEGDGGEEPEVNLSDVIKSGKRVDRERYLLTLMSKIVNQLHDASDLWSEYITPNLSKIPKLKFDSFVNSKIISDFENAINQIETQATSLTIKHHYPYLDKVYTSLIEVLDDLFNMMNADIKRYSSGINISGGYLHVKAPYNPFVSKSSTKYLM